MKTYLKNLTVISKAIFAVSLLATDVPHAFAEQPFENLELRWVCQGNLEQDAGDFRPTEPNQPVSFEIRFDEQDKERIVIRKLIALGSEWTDGTDYYGGIYESGYVNTGRGSRPLKYVTQIKPYINASTDHRSTRKITEKKPEP